MIMSNLHCCAAKIEIYILLYYYRVYCNFCLCAVLGTGDLYFAHEYTTRALYNVYEMVGMHR